MEVDVDVRSGSIDTEVAVRALWSALYRGPMPEEPGRHGGRGPFCCKFSAHDQKSMMRRCFIIAADRPKLSPVIASPAYLVAVPVAVGAWREFSDDGFESFGGPP